MFDARVLLKSISREIFTVSGVLKAAVRHLGDHRNMSINPDAAKVERLGHAHGAAMVFCPNAGGETVFDPICQGLEPLLTQMAADCARAKEIIASTKGQLG